MSIAAETLTLVNTYTSDRQELSDVIELANGGWVVVWQSAGQDGENWGVYAQAYNADGTKLGAERRVATTTDDAQWNAHGTALADGGWTIAWGGDTTSSNTDIYQRTFNADGSARN